MRIESVTAHAFGPLVDQSLELAPGMNVIAGVNESAKSSWHAAIYAALVGRRRGRGASTKQERAFAAKHRPWDHPDWRVSAVVVLNDGRRVELTHDLEGKVDCRAMDLALGRDVSDEIMHDGAPDASRWLGLDRTSFAATACVSQAQLLSVLASADGLQEHLQRAASTAGTDATAAAALTALDTFMRERVGRDQANSTRPLRKAKDRLAAAQAALDRARSAHEEYLELVEDADVQRAAAAAAEDAVRAAEDAHRSAETLVSLVRDAATAAERVGLAERQAQDAATRLTAESERLDRIEKLHATFPDGPPARHEDAEHQSRAVTDALAAWRAAPAPPTLHGPTAADLEAQVEPLPAAPEGDTAVSAQVRTALDRYQNAVAVAQAHDDRRPQVTEGLHERPDVAAAVAAGPAVVRDLASQLDGVRSTEPDTADLDRQLEQARRALAAARAAGAPAASGPRTALVGWVLAGLAAALAVVLGVAGQVPAAVGAGLVAAVAAVGAVVLGRRRAAPTGSSAPPADVLAAERTVAELEGRRAAALSAVQRAEAVRAEIESRASARGLPTDPQRLRELAAQAEQVLEERGRLDRWERDAHTCAEDVTAAGDRLRAALADRGHPVQDGEPVENAVRAYEEQCALRAQTAAAAARRDSLLAALDARRREEAAAVQAHRRREEAGEALRSAAALVGVTDAAGPGGADDDLNLLAVRLEQWQQGQDAAAAGREQRQREWSELTTLLAGDTVEDVRKNVQVLAEDRDRADLALHRDRQVAAEAAERRDQHARANGVTGSLDAQAAAQHVQVTGEALDAARAEARQAAARAEHADGVLQERARTLPSVAEAEEELAAATAELDRVTELSRTLTLTQQFLTRAQDTVHRDIAPVIATTLRGWLPVVTEGRYVDATVDPATLRVQVCGPERRWRSADQLSVGTAEQVYLLLRVALAEHLTTEGETSPLLLDDVTVQADDGRTRQLLDLLLRLSEERQIMLFAQEPVVLDWAKERLFDEQRHSVVELPRLVVV